MLNFELFFFIEACRIQGLLTWKQINVFLGAWCWPKAVTAPSKTLCGEKHEKSCRDASIFKGSASHLLGFYPVLRELARRLLGGQASIAKELKSFFMLCHVLDGFALIQGGIRPPSWASAIAAWFDAWKAAYPDEVPKPKHHMAMHLPHMFDKFKILPTCFTLERKHRTFKGFGSGTTKLEGYEKSLTFSMLNEQLRGWEEGSCFRRGMYLIDARPAGEDLLNLINATGVSSAWYSPGASYKSRQTWVGDFIVFF